ncbi:Integrase catalytic domain-containing protein [Fagus crenata]
MYLCCFTSDKPKLWVRRLCWAEFCYNTSWHSAIKRTPFEVVYGREPPSLLTYVPGTAKVAAVEDELLQRDLVLTDLKENIKVAQERMKRSYDSKHCEKNFEVGNWVYLRLRPYRQVSVAMRRNAKLSPWFYGPFHILQRIGQVAYKLELPLDTRIHPVFHVSLLKEKLGSKISVQPQLPITVGDHNELRVRPMTILDRRKCRNVEEVLVQWQGLPTSEATWENLTAMKSQFPEYALEDKDHRKGKGV